MELIAKPHNLASTLALQIYSQVLDEVRGDHLVYKAMERIGDSLFIQGQHIDLNHFDRVWIAGSGKAVVAMAQAATSILGDRLAGGLIVTKAGGAEPVTGLSVLEAGHPVPDSASLSAGESMLAFAAKLDEKDLVIYLLSGGSSALIESLAGNLSLEDLQKTTQVLLESGCDIRLMNSVRTRLSRRKGGRLGSAFYPATVVNLVLSDVVGNDLSAVGSGPFIAKLRSDSPVSEAPFDQFPTEVQKVLLLNNSTPILPEPIQHFVIGSVSLAIHAAVAACKQIGLLALPFGDPMQGEAREMAQRICRHGIERQRDESCMIFGGETTVHIRGEGLGGRCQEMALAAVEPLTKLRDVSFLAGGTDGTDGPTDAAGGFVDPESLERASLLGFEVDSSLDENDSYHYLQACDGLIITGPTGSNVTDIALFVTAS